MTVTTSATTRPAPFDLATVDRLLTCTRAARRSLDLGRPVDRATIEECLEIAVHAPTASNRQSWRWVVVTDPAVKEGIAHFYRLAWEHYLSMTSNRAGRRARVAAAEGRGPDNNLLSARFLVEHLAEIPVLIVPCLQGRPPGAEAIDRRLRASFESLEATGHTSLRGAEPVRPSSMGLVRQAVYFGSIFPAMWSLQLALRSRGLGSAITSMHVPYERQVGELLGIPWSVTQVGLLPVAHLSRELGPSPRRMACEVTRWEHW
jgi:nitroreductase